MVKVKKNTIVKDGLECLKHDNWSTLITLLSLISWGNLNNFLTVKDENGLEKDRQLVVVI